MPKPEQKLQIQVANYIRLRYPHCLWTISPVGLIINRHLGMLSVRLGYRKGTPDLLFFEPRGIFHGLVLELKDVKGSVSEDQTEFIAAAHERRYATAVCWNYQEAIETIDNYLNLKGGQTNEQDQVNGQGIPGQEQEIGGTVGASDTTAPTSPARNPYTGFKAITAQEESPF